MVDAFTFENLSLKDVVAEEAYNPTTSQEVVAEFLTEVFGELEPGSASLNFAAVSEDTMFSGRCFRSVSDAVDWIENANQSANAYWCAGIAPPQVSRPKLRKTDVSAVVGLAVDLDEPSAVSAFQQNLVAHNIPDPSLIVRTGTVPADRLQLFWLFNEPEEDLEAWVAVSDALTECLGGDPAVGGDYSHLLRLPGTTTFPKEEKRAKGYESEVTELLMSTGTRYELMDFEDLAQHCQAVKREAMPTLAPKDNEGTCSAILPELPPDIVTQLRLPMGEHSEKRHKHVYRCCALLFEKGISPEQVVDVIRAYPDGVGHKWMTDWGGSIPTLLARVVANFGRWQKEQAKDGVLADAIDAMARNAAANDNETKPLVLRRMGEVLELKIPPRNPILGPWLLEKSLNLVHAPRGLGKTHFVTAVAMAVAGGGSFLDWDAAGPRRVVILDGEMPLRALQDRYTQAASHYPEVVKDNLILISSEDHLEGMPDLSTEEGQKVLDAVLEEGDLLVVDNISTLCRTGVENDAESWAPVQQWLISLRRRDISVILVAHDGKSGDQRGTSKKEDIMDNVIHLTKPNPKERYGDGGAEMKVEFSKCRNSPDGALMMFQCWLDKEGEWHMHDGYTAKQKKVIELRKLGTSYRGIEDVSGVKKSTAERVVKRARKDGLLE